MWRLIVAWAVACAGGKDVSLPPVDDTDDVESDLPDTDPPGVVDTFDEHAPPELVELPPGTFELGSAPTDVGAGPSERSHQVTLTHRFAVGAYEVTQSQFESWMGYEPSYWGGCPRCPVESVSWHEAAAYLNKLSEAEGLPACFSCTQLDAADPRSMRCQPEGSPYACAGYRLPTEAEWE
ncbi:MAG TPA: SUMF1/EgtB/PvdO family nonheme iron enzyme, partial [Myxococcota bacterium]|nr:SUMF1/EgtB/PvdO family nonheme iron enzyme [Myxococcota bacterium]